MKYQVHRDFIDPNGTVVKKGIYDEHQIDVAIAKNRSTVTTIDTNLVITSEDNLVVTPLKIMSESVDVPVKDFTAQETIVKVPKLKINTASIDDIKAVKFVGKATAEKVVKERTANRFTDYADLDKRVPLGKRKWVDLTPIDFEFTHPITESNSVNYL